MYSRKVMKSALETMMFMWGEPLEVKDAADVLEAERSEVRELLRELQNEYEQEGRGIIIREINGAFQYVTREENAPYIERLCTPVKSKRLSQSALEVLAIVAYKQPVTRIEIEKIRGVSCDHAVNKLLEYNLITELGRLDAPGKPILFGTTEEFLRSFGVKSLEELPEAAVDRIEEFRKEAAEELQLKLDI